MSTESDFFSSLDEGFANFDDKNNNPTLLFKGSNQFLQPGGEFVLPIPVIAGSNVKYQFSTTDGDIQFSTSFNGGNVTENIVQPARVPSNTEHVKGGYKATCAGSLLLKFDNSFSWFTPKYLSYQIRLYQPAFTAADSARCTKCRALLEQTTADIRRAEADLDQSQMELAVLGDEIPALEERLALLRAQLREKKTRLGDAYSRAEQTSALIEANLEKKNGLCLRCVLRRGDMGWPWL
jgi:hypothetical protein